MASSPSPQPFLLNGGKETGQSPSVPPSQGGPGVPARAQPLERVALELSVSRVIHMVRGCRRRSGPGVDVLGRLPRARNRPDDRAIPGSNDTTLPGSTPTTGAANPRSNGSSFWWPNRAWESRSFRASQRKVATPASSGCGGFPGWAPRDFATAGRSHPRRSRSLCVAGGIPGRLSGPFCRNPSQHGRRQTNENLHARR
jgi:hypothetical protein